MFFATLKPSVLDELLSVNYYSMILQCYDRLVKYRYVRRILSPAKKLGGVFGSVLPANITHLIIFVHSHCPIVVMILLQALYHLFLWPQLSSCALCLFWSISISLTMRRDSSALLSICDPFLSGGNIDVLYAQKHQVPLAPYIWLP